MAVVVVGASQKKNGREGDASLLLLLFSCTTKGLFTEKGKRMEKDKKKTTYSYVRTSQSSLIFWCRKSASFCLLYYHVRVHTYPLPCSVSGCFFVVFCNHGIYQYTYVYRLHLCVHLWLSLGMGTYYVRCPSFPSSVFSIFLLLSLSELCMACTIKTLDGFCLSRNQTSLYVNSQLFSLSQPCEAF